MDNKDTQYQIIANSLITTGIFAISDIENKSKLSRESIGKILRKLVNANILKKTSNKGKNVKYKLTRHIVAITFIFNHIDRLNIDNFARAWNVSTNSAKKYIKQFIDDGIINKFGTPPQKIIYTINSQKHNYNFSKEQTEIIEKYYLYTTPDGQLLEGIKGFVYWAENKSKRKNIESLAQEYLDIRKKYYDQRNGILMIDATDKLKNIFHENVYIKKLFHQDFDALPIFGKTKLSQMIRIAKSGHTNKFLMISIVDKIQKSINNIFTKYNIDCVGFIPPTVIRKTQIMTFTANKLIIPCDRINISKIKNLVPVQQKSLKKIEDRILNAKETISVENTKKYKNILLIDDVTGSGATLNETAKKIITQNIAQNVYAFTITGSAKSGIFDIIPEA
ncbi:hypothetical protein KAI92_00085 [Candidatus Parcubacteria bacterium]|nr:hypothetical protein [Candidatus Parcubacteria bacterium]